MLIHFSHFIVRYHLASFLNPVLLRLPLGPIDNTSLQEPKLFTAVWPLGHSGFSPGVCPFYRQHHKPRSSAGCYSGLVASRPPYSNGGRRSACVNSDPYAPASIHEHIHAWRSVSITRELCSQMASSSLVTHGWFCSLLVDQSYPILAA